MAAVLTGCGMLAQVKNYPIINDCLAQVRRKGSEKLIEIVLGLKYSYLDGLTLGFQA